MAIAFKTVAQKYQNKAFLVPNLKIFISAQILAVWKIREISIMIMVFQSYSQNFFWILHKISYFAKFKSSDFKYENSF